MLNPHPCKVASLSSKNIIISLVGLLVSLQFASSQTSSVVDNTYSFLETASLSEIEKGDVEKIDIPNELESYVLATDYSSVSSFYTMHNVTTTDVVSSEIETSSIFCYVMSTVADLLNVLLNAANDEYTLYVCSGKLVFNETLVFNSTALTNNDVKLVCVGLWGSCIFDGNSNTRLFNFVTGAVADFRGFSFVNGYIDDAGAVGGTVESVIPLRFTGCLFLYNVAEATDNDICCAAAITAFNDLEVNQGYFLENKAKYIGSNTTKGSIGGAIFASGGSSVRVRNTVFNGNEATGGDFGSGRGGAIFASAVTTLNVTSSVFQNNFASKSGAVAYVTDEISFTDYEIETFSEPTPTTAPIPVEFTTDWTSNVNLFFNKAFTCNGVQFEGGECVDVTESTTVVLSN